ncbi:Lrp/AsnC family transcriptional regulator [Azospirillum brasilense]|nr:Lrp/AsnC family transcriptional regulator [Azospirillum brasilense]QEL97329.1 Lrp/AsnC family transcriptional regulator [Azospirillum brasilense]
MKTAWRDRSDQRAKPRGAGRRQHYQTLRTTLRHGRDDEEATNHIVQFDPSIRPAVTSICRNMSSGAESMVGQQPGDVDMVDELILCHLEADGRQSVQELARKVNLSRSAVYARIQRLVKAGVIAGFTIRRGVPVPKPVVSAYMILYLTGPICEKVAKEIEKIPQVKLSQSIGGEIDMILTVETGSLEDLNDVRGRIEAIKGVVRVNTCVILKERFNRLRR